MDPINLQLLLYLLLLLFLFYYSCLSCLWLGLINVL